MWLHLPTYLLLNERIPPAPAQAVRIPIPMIDVCDLAFTPLNKLGLPLGGGLFTPWSLPDLPLGLSIQLPLLWCRQAPSPGAQLCLRRNDKCAQSRAEDQKNSL